MSLTIQMHWLSVLIIDPGYFKWEYIIHSSDANLAWNYSTLMEPHVSIQWNRIKLVNLLLPDVCTITGYMNVGVLVVFNELTFPSNNFIGTSFLFDIDKRYWETLAHSKGSWWYPVKIAGSGDHIRKFWNLEPKIWSFLPKTWTPSLLDYWS